MRWAERAMRGRRGQGWSKVLDFLSCGSEQTAGPDFVEAERAKAANRMVMPFVQYVEH